MADGDWFSMFLEVGLDLGETADIASGDEVGVGGEDVLGFLFAEGVGDFGLVDVVGAGGAAAEVGVGYLGEGGARDHFEQIAGLGGDALGVGEVAGVVVGDGLLFAGI